MLDALTLGQIRTFVTIAEAGSFRQGAARLLRAQSAVSHAVAGLEAELGVKLFDRSGHRPVLTDHGAALLENARAVLLKVDAMRARAHGLRAGLEIQLPLVVDTLFPLPVLSDALCALHAGLPTVAVQVSVLPLSGPILALQEGRCVMSIAVGEDFPDPRLVLEPLMTVGMVPVVAPHHPLAGLGSASHSESLRLLEDHLQIVLQDPGPLSEGRDFGVLSPQTWRVRSQEAKHALIRAGAGWGRLPSWSVERELREGVLVALPSGFLGAAGHAEFQSYLAHRTDQALGPAARKLRQELLDRCRAGSGGGAPA
jgi:DNA-binding transcriptional LysR family regulator